MSYPCTKCGACCKLAGAIKNFPEPLKTASRQCVHLMANMKCAIYGSRPDVCRIKGDHAANAIACNELQAMTKTPTRFRLHILDNN